jgi:hypothetical protein
MSNAKSLKVTETSLGRMRAEAISAIEGQVLSGEQRDRFRKWEAALLSPEQQRAQIMRIYKCEAATE